MPRADDRRSGMISTHAPARGATLGFPARFPQIFHFYSRPCERGDLHGHEHSEVYATLISTHAPARGATGGRLGTIVRVISFLLTPLREGRPPGPSTGSTFGVFLLTPLREGRRGIALLALRAVHISTHAPARGATILPGGRIPGVDHISTHAPARGATSERKDELEQYIVISTHAPARGATEDVSAWLNQFRISTHAPARGATDVGI